MDFTKIIHRFKGWGNQLLLFTSIAYIKGKHHLILRKFTANDSIRNTRWNSGDAS